jgi:hypothetical protein
VNGRREVNGDVAIFWWVECVKEGRDKVQCWFGHYIPYPFVKHMMWYMDHTLFKINLRQNAVSFKFF